ncbi:hypothetical protein [Nostoc sp.]|uniref:hypothetical protein n=1 Tax=Nostoc sp. TaxID=1180 RepID=UPI002FF63195
MPHVRMALRKDIALALTGSQPLGWERGDTSLWAFLSAIRPMPNAQCPNGTKLRYSPYHDWFLASRLGTHSGRLCLLFLDQRRSLSEYVPSLEAGNEATQAFGLFLVPFAQCPIPN